MTTADQHREEARRLRREAAKREVLFFGVEIWPRLADLHENIAARLDEVTATQSDMPAIVDGK